MATGATLSLNPTVAQGSVVVGDYSQTVGSLAGGGDILLGGATLKVGNAASTTFTGMLYGTGALVKVGTGTLSLTGTTYYSGGTTVNAGTLAVANPRGYYTTNATLEFSSGTLAADVNGTGALVKSGNGAFTLYGNNGYAGGTTIAGGRLIVYKPSGDYANGGVLELPGGELSSGELSGVVSGTGSLDKTRPGTVTLTGLNTYTGGTTVDDGRLVVLNPNGSYVTNAVLEIRNVANSSFDGSTVSGPGTFAKSGAGVMTLTRPLANTGGIFIDEGTLKGSAAVFRGESIVGQAGASLQVDFTGSGYFAGQYSGAGDFVKSGTGRLFLDGSLANTGATSIVQGAIYALSAARLNGLNVAKGTRFLNDSTDVVEFSRPVVTQGEIATLDGSTTVFDGLVSGAGVFTGLGTVRFDGGYHPGNSPASVTFQGDLALEGSNDLVMELGGTALGTGYDHLSVLGTATLGGALNVAYYGGFSASLGQSFDLFDFASSTGTFASVTLPTLANGLAWNTSALYTTGTIRVQSVPEPASLAALSFAVVLLRRRKR